MTACLRFGSTLMFALITTNLPTNPSSPDRHPPEEPNQPERYSLSDLPGSPRIVSNQDYHNHRFR